MGVKIIGDDGNFRVSGTNVATRTDAMVRNNIELDIKTKCIEQGKTQVQIAEDIDTTKAYVNRIIKRTDGVVNKTFVQMMESLGYDIEITYVKREAE